MDEGVKISQSNIIPNEQEMTDLHTKSAFRKSLHARFSFDRQSQFLHITLYTVYVRIFRILISYPQWNILSWVLPCSSKIFKWSHPYLQQGHGIHWEERGITFPPPLRAPSQISLTSCYYSIYQKIYQNHSEKSQSTQTPLQLSIPGGCQDHCTL